MRSGCRYRAEKESAKVAKALTLSSVGFLLLIPCCVSALSSRPSQAELASITARGVLLAEYDSAAWHATDAVAALAQPIENSRYIAHKTTSTWVVDFGHLNQSHDRFLVAYEAVQIDRSESFDVKHFDPLKADTGWNLVAATAIETALRDFGATSCPYNVAAVPAEHEAIYVYLYPAQVKLGVYPLGADARYLFSSDGTRIIEKRQLHKTIIESLPTRAKAVGYHTHVLSEVPEDTDVLLVLSRHPRIPEIVIAGPYMFTIDINGTISIEDLPR